MCTLVLVSLLMFQTSVQIACMRILMTDLSCSLPTSYVQRFFFFAFHLYIQGLYNGFILLRVFKQLYGGLILFIMCNFVFVLLTGVIHPHSSLHTIHTIHTIHPYAHHTPPLTYTRTKGFKATAGLSFWCIRFTQLQHFDTLKLICSLSPSIPYALCAYIGVVVVRHHHLVWVNVSAHGGKCIQFIGAQGMVMYNDFMPNLS